MDSRNPHVGRPTTHPGSGLACPPADAEETVTDPAPAPATTALAADERADSEFAGQMPLLYRLTALAPDSPEWIALRAEVITAFLPVGERLAATHSRGSPWLREDLRQVAAEAIVAAVDRWDPDKAHGEFLGYLVPCVRGSLLRYFRDHSWSLRVPRRLKELHAAVQRALPDLAQALGRAPRPSDLARHLDVSVEEVLETLRAAENRSTATLDAPGEDERPTGERVGDEDGRYAVVEDIQTLSGLVRRLPVREREILRMRFYEDRTQSQIAAVVGISQMHVSRILAHTLADLREAMLDDDPRGDEPRSGEPSSGEPSSAEPPGAEPPPA